LGTPAPALSAPCAATESGSNPVAAHRKAEVLHKLHSTRIHDRAETPPGLVAGRPKCPKLTREARRIFKLLCRQLEDRRALTAGDGHLLALYATLWDRHERAQAKLLAEGEICIYTRMDSNGQAHQVEKPNLSLKIAQDTERQMVAILDRLGLSPLAGTKVKQTRLSDADAPAEPGTIAYILQNSAPQPAFVPEPVPATEINFDEEEKQNE